MTTRYICVLLAMLPMSNNEPCFICRGQAVHAIAVPVGEDAEDSEFIDVYAVHVCSECFAFREEIADQIRQHIADRPWGREG